MNKLKYYRELKNTSQGQLEYMTGISKRLIRAYEQDYRDLKKAQGKTLLALAKALGCAIEDLIDDGKDTP